MDLFLDQLLDKPLSNFGKSANNSQFYTPH